MNKPCFLGQQILKSNVLLVVWKGPDYIQQLTVGLGVGRRPASIGKRPGSMGSRPPSVGQGPGSMRQGPGSMGPGGLGGR